MTYRSDIDGLRGVAVLCVVFYHLFPSALGGGFIGVDIFFVISGYLITSIVLNQRDRGSFSLMDFYKRRLHRLGPALLLVVGSTLTASWFLLLPDEYSHLGKHALAGLGFSANILLWFEAGYFDVASHYKPFLHLWSLGVEEQFYLFWPLLIMLLASRQWYLWLISSLLLGLSFIIGVSLLESDEIGAFYLPWARFWELGLGACLAMYNTRDLTSYEKDGGGRLLPLVSVNFPRAILANLNHVLSVTGIGSIIVGLALIDEQSAFPGVMALFPVLGAFLLISAGPKATINTNLLSSKPLVWVGLISYPLYLWHWPLISLATIMHGSEPSIPARLLILGVSMLLAWLTFLILERPFRKGILSRSTGTVLLMSTTAILLLGSTVVWLQKGFPERRAFAVYESNLAQLASMQEDDPVSHDQCLDAYKLKGYVRYCNVSGAQPKFALIGDSHARAMFPGFAQHLASRGEGALNVGGRLFLGVQAYPIGSEFEIKVNEGGLRATQMVVDHPDVEYVALLSRGPAYLVENPKYLFALKDQPQITDRLQVWEVGMRKTLDALLAKGKQVTFVIDNAELGFHVKTCLARPFNFFADARTPCAVSRAEFDQRNADYRNLVIRVLEDYPQVKVFDAAAYLCDENWCYGMIDGELVYSDDNHLSDYGSYLLGPHLYDVMIGAKKSKRFID